MERCASRCRTHRRMLWATEQQGIYMEGRILVCLSTIWDLLSTSSPSRTDGYYHTGFVSRATMSASIIVHVAGCVSEFRGIVQHLSEVCVTDSVTGSILQAFTIRDYMQ